MAECFVPPNDQGPLVYKGPLLLPRPSNSVPPLLNHAYFYSSSTSSSPPIIGRSAALKIHSQAEKRRRERINAHLSTLRRMVPDANKMDKASLLGKVIDHVKLLKRRAVETSKGLAIPTEVNKVTVECQEGDVDAASDYKTFQIEASICCDDHPELFMSLARAFHSLRLRIITADIVTLGGRVHTVFKLCRKDGNETVCLCSLKASIKEAVERIIVSFDNEAVDASCSKRLRVLQSHYSAISL